MICRITPRGALAVLWLFPGLAVAQQPSAPPKAEPPVAALRTLLVYPAHIALQGPRDEQRVGILGKYADGRTWDLSRAVKVVSSAPKIVAIDAGNVARPVGDGQAMLTMTAGGQSKTIAVTVKGASADLLVDFTREITPVLTRAGCNQGACHGAQHGRGGFRLSLLGFDPLFDHAQIVQSAEGRRVVLSDAERSILLQKPALLMEHGGGQRIMVGGREYTYLKRWLEDGAPEPSAKDPEVTAIEVWPPRRIMVRGEQQQLLVKATWKDGKTEDVTATAQFNTLNDGVAAVGADGLVIQAFLADTSPDKRQKAIDKVIERPEFVDFWALKWGDLLRIHRDALNERGMWSFHNWVRACLRDKKPLDEMVRDIITAEGSTFTEGPANYFMVARNAGDWAETTAQLFLGVRIGCAKCHHHPFEKWSQEDYAGMSAFFVRLGTKASREFGIFGGEQVVFLKPAGEQAHPRKGGLVKPHPLGGADMDDPIDRRVKLADWITAPDNPFFARNVVNRFWGYLMGRGLVEPLDDMRATNPASNLELLDALADDFVKHKYDLRHLVRTIVSSRGYQLASKNTSANKGDALNVHFTRHTVRRLSAEQLADAIDFAAGTVEKYPGLPLGTRAIQLPDSGVKSFLLDTFGRPARQITCECERTTQPNIAQALHLLNGEFLNKKVGDPKGRLDALLKAKKDMPEIVTELYLVTLSRPPVPEEMERARHWISQAASPREGLQDVLWALMNSREFLFNH